MPEIAMSLCGEISKSKSCLYEVHGKYAVRVSLVDGVEKGHEDLIMPSFWKNEFIGHTKVS